MPEETPNFSSTSISEEPVKKRRTYRRHRVVRAEKPERAVRTPKEDHPIFLEKNEKIDKKELDKNLTSIYSDHGKMPDMKKIRVKKSNPFVRGLITLLIFGGILAAAAWSGFFILPNQNKFSDTQLELKVSGPEIVALGNEETYNISYENKQNIKLNNAVLSIKYPETFSYSNSSMAPENSGHTEWKIGTIGPKQKGNITITGKSYGATDQTGSWRVFLTYQPENFNSELQKLTTLNTKIGQSPFTITISGQDKITAGTDTEYTFTVTNSNTWWPDKIELIPTWPKNFTLTSSDPTIVKGNKWTIASANIQASTSTGQIAPLIYKIKGKWTENTDPTVTSSLIKASLNLTYNSQTFSIAESSLNTQVEKNNIALSLAINGSNKDFSTQPGDTLNMILNLKNTSQTDLNKASIKLSIIAPSYKNQSVLNWSNIVDKYDGSIEGKQLNDTERQGTITWNSATIKELAKLKPNQEINIELRLPFKDLKTFDWDQIKNFKINLASEVVYTDANGNKQTVAGNPIVATINSNLKFESRDTVSTDAGGLEKHQISWILTNDFHPLKNLQLSAEVFGDITFIPPTEVPAGKFNFDNNAKKITWTIPEMPTSLDTLALSFDIIINKKNPTQNMLVSKVRVQAEDVVTDSKLDLAGDEIPLTAN